MKWGGGGGRRGKGLMFCLPWDNWDNLAVKAAAGPGKMETYSFLNWTPKRGSVILYDCLLPVPDWWGGGRKRERETQFGGGLSLIHI